MAITASDITFPLSGGAANSSGAASLGGIISSNAVSSALHAFFDRVTGSESAAGDIEYRCLYVKNTHATLTLYSTYVWISTNTPSTDTTIAIGLGTAATAATEQTVADELTAPTAVSFSSPSSYGTGLAIGDLAPGEYKAVWIRRTITAGAAAYNSDGATLSVQGDTGA